MNTNENMQTQQWRIATEKKQKIDQEVIFLRNKGFTYNQIARSLNKAGLKTIRGREFTEGNVFFAYKNAQSNVTSDHVQTAPEAEKIFQSEKLFTSKGSIDDTNKSNIENNLLLDLLINMMFQNKSASAKDLFETFTKVRANRVTS